MTVDLRAEEERERIVLYERIRAVLQQYGEEDVAGAKRDYLLVEEGPRAHQHRIETGKLELAQPIVIKSLQKLLVGFPNWEIVIALGRSYGGVVIRDDEIVDALQRENLPKEFKTIEYEGSRPLGSHFRDVIYGAEGPS
jgi:hypothetical protein